MVEWLRLQAVNAGDPGSTPGQETKIPHATWCSQKVKKEKKKKAAEPKDLKKRENKMTLERLWTFSGQNRPFVSYHGPPQIALPLCTKFWRLRILILKEKL